MARENRQVVAVWFSCGAASAVAAKLTLHRYGDEFDVRVVNSPVVEEGVDNQRFLRDAEKWLGVEIETATNPKFEGCSAEAVWRQERYMSGVAGASCTRALKRIARYCWEDKYGPVAWHVLGFTIDEQARHDRFVKSEIPNVLPVLIDAGLTKQDCIDLIANAGIRLPEAYRLGYPNANCRGCVKATSVAYWAHVRRVDPDVFRDRAVLSREIGCRLVRLNGERIFLDELPEDLGDTGVVSTLDVPDCAFFCEEANASEPTFFQRMAAESVGLV